MCGRFGLFDGIDDLARDFNISPAQLANYAPRWNIAPTIPILTLMNGNIVHFARWGMPGGKGKRPLFNARGETVHRLPTFREAFRSARCLIPASGFYEWRQDGDGGKTPVWVHHVDERPFAFAGIIGGDTEPAAAIVTCEPNSLMAQIHHRMPVILEPEDYGEWLSSIHASASFRSLIQPREWEQMTLRTVSRSVNRASNDGPDLVAPVAAPTARLL